YLIDLGELDEAEDVLQPILARSIDAELLRLRIELLKGRPVDAQAQAILRRPDAGKRFGLPLAMIFLANGQPKRCEEICLTGLEENPSDVDLRAPLAEAYLMTGERKKCIEQWEKTVSAKPNSLPAYERLAALFTGEGILDANTDDAATQPSDSAVRLSMDQLTKALDDAHKRLVTMPGARRHLVDLAVAGQYARLRQYDKASELYAKVVGDAATEDPLRYRAQMLRAVMLSRSGKPDEALRELDRLIGALAKSPSWKSRATYAKADLLAAMLAAGRRRLAALNRQEESPARQQAIEAAQRSTQDLRGQVKAVLAKLCKEAEAEGDARILRQAAGLCARTGDPEGALSACDSVEKLLPKDPRSYALRAEVLTVAGKPEEVPGLYRKAIELQPGDFRLYMALAAAQEGQGRPMDAISTLERLDKVSQSGRVYSLHLQGTVLSNWGLQKQAVAKFEQLAQLPYGANPQLQWSLAGSLARLGSADKALAAIEEIPEYARDYVPAQLLKARLTEGVDKKRAVLRALAAKRPADERVVLEEMSLLLSEDRPAEAVAAFEAFRNSKEIAGRFPPRSSALALRAATRAGDLAKARELVAAIAERNPTPVWQLAAQLLCMEDEPATVRKGLPEPAKAGLLPATIGLCLARRAGDGEAVKQWAGRLDELDKALNRYRGASFPAALRLLCALLAGDKPLAALCVARLGSDPRGAAAKELADHADGSPRSTDEIIRLVGVFLARQVQLDDLARQWAMEALKARPACLWAAVEVSQTASPLTDLKEALALVKPPDCELAQLLRAEVHLREKQPKEAAAIFGSLAGKSGTPNPGYLLPQAMALNAAGEFLKALDLYRQILRLTKSPVAANNAACLVMQSSPKDAAKLAEARQWMDEALKTAAASPYLEDTAGWVAHLQGRDADALPLLRRAVKGLPESPDVQYHLGAVEAKAGDAQLARWHLEAAVDQGKKLRAEGKEIAKATEEAIRSAEAQLAAFGQPKGTNP
ncbi:MAG TPA: tetratricopeptide repeat protein, partial [Phycisphaerae bacterium]|nr:tetratricopeptide repeat protein [Phycisphaerae bacterium]